MLNTHIYIYIYI